MGQGIKQGGQLQAIAIMEGREEMDGDSWLSCYEDNMASMRSVQILKIF